MVDCKYIDKKRTQFLINLVLPICALFFLLSFPTMAQVTAALDSTSIKIGEEVKYSIQVEADTTAFVLFPEGQTFLPLEMIESYKGDTLLNGSKYRLLKKYGLTQFDSGRYKIPSQQIIINDKRFSTDTLEIQVRDVLVDTTKQKMYDIKEKIGVKRPGIDLLTLLYWILPLLLIGGIIFYFFRRKKRKEAEEALPPYEEALISLKNLDSSGLLIQNKSKEYYSTLTEIVKRYLDREVDDQALESTSNELIERLQMHKEAGHFEFNNTTIKELDEILKRADLVKFAKMQQGSGQAEADRNSIEKIINVTHDSIPEPTEEELLQNERYLEAQRIKRRNKKIIIGVVSVLVAGLIALGVFVATYGVTYVKDNLIGHPTKELLDGQWVKSDYGIPAVTIETPKVLARIPMEFPAEVQQAIKANDAFAYGSLMGNFYVFVNTVQYKASKK